MNNINTAVWDCVESKARLFASLSKKMTPFNFLIRGGEIIKLWCCFLALSIIPHAVVSYMDELITRITSDNCDNPPPHPILHQQISNSVHCGFSPSQTRRSAQLSFSEVPRVHPPLYLLLQSVREQFPTKNVNQSCAEAVQAKACECRQKFWPRVQAAFLILIIVPHFKTIILKNNEFRSSEVLLWCTVALSPIYFLFTRKFECFERFLISFSINVREMLWLFKQN